ncbi:hypothetical protein [Haloplasma contractile]|uniref:Rubredoxin-like domain-containing protein n=1 Tax=Haloplasma contractile SSD-17B TaxID=1033810 RepID=U2DSJ1_9MOLU|nr:hypothetical protein [Haloplasma contractile]ERJ11487.1 hypothetical protein HLPCO_002399 [Haloplasma contractile SSD-17B]
MKDEKKDQPEPGIYECPDCGQLQQVDERDYSIPPCPGCNIDIDSNNKVNKPKTDQ